MSEAQEHAKKLRQDYSVFTDRTWRVLRYELSFKDTCEYVRMKMDVGTSVNMIDQVALLLRRNPNELR